MPRRTCPRPPPTTTRCSDARGVVGIADDPEPRSPVDPSPQFVHASPLNEGRAFTPAEALANGAVDYVVPQDEVVAKATELAARFGSRVRGSVASIRRSVYFGGSMPLTQGLDVESAEFVTRIPSEDAQNIMRNYMETTDATGEIPFYNPDAYAQALASGSMPGRSSTDKP